MDWKGFLKPNKKKMNVFVLFNFIFLPALFFGFIGLLEIYSLTPLMIILSFFFGIPFIITAVFNLVGIFGFASIIITTIITIFYWYLLACIIAWVYDKISPKFPEYKPLTILGFSILMVLIGFYSILSSFQSSLIVFQIIIAVFNFLIGIFALLTALYFFMLRRSALKFIYIYLVLTMIVNILLFVNYQISYQEPYSIFPMLISFSIILFNLILVLLARNYVNNKQVKHKPLFT